MGGPNAQTILQWQGLIQQALSLGVKSWSALHALLQDAGADEVTIATLKGKWDLLYSDVARAAGK